MVLRKRRTALRAAGLALTVSLVGGAAEADAPGPVGVQANPRLDPGFQRDAHDYAVRCDKDTPVKLTFDASGSTRVSVNGRPGRRGHFTAGVRLAGGRALSFAIDSGPDAGDYHVRCLPSDFPAYSVKRYASPQAGWYVVSPDVWGRGVPDYAIVFDKHGAPVWWMRDPNGAPMNASVLPGWRRIAWYTYTGGPFGVDPAVGYGVHAFDGKLVHTYRAHGGPTDLHELQVLPNRHAMLIRYKPRGSRVDLSRYGRPKDARVVDGQMQEVDRGGRRVWSWNTKDHIALSEAGRWLRMVNPQPLRDGRWVYDLAHLNTIDPHGARIVISLRYTDAIYEIDRATGRVLWKLGGTQRPESLRVVGDTYAGKLLFSGQHDARLSGDGTLLSVYDNRSYTSGLPRAALYRIDAANRMATLLGSITDPAVTKSECCGGARRLPGGDWVIAWGHRSLVTEADADGHRVLALKFPHRTTYRAVPILPGGLDPARLRAGMDAMAAK